MAGILFNDIIFGPIRSRRLGNSLGINLLPKNNKVCTFNCVYCECGWGDKSNIQTVNFHPASIIIPVISETMKRMAEQKNTIDSITFSGNGEPTMHPEFETITDAIIELRNRYYPDTIISCLSNSTQLHRSDVVAALKKIENPLMKLDTGIQETFLLINKPYLDLNINTVCKQLLQFSGKLTIQTMFLRGELEEGDYIDNTTEIEVNAWIERLNYIRPHTVMIYPIDRETPASNLQKIDIKTLESIAAKVRKTGIKTLTYA